MVPDEHYETLYWNEYNEQSLEDKDIFLAAIAQDTISKAEDVFESVLDSIRRECVAEQLSRLKPRERDVLKERYGFEGEPKTFEEVGQMLGVTRERVRQIEAKALKKLQHPSYKKKLEDFY